MRYLLACLALCVTTSLWGQQATISGTVKDASGEPLIGVNVYTSPDEGETVWTDPYYFFTTRDAGMTVSTKWKHPSG